MKKIYFGFILCILFCSCTKKRDYNHEAMQEALNKKDYRNVSGHLRLVYLTGNEKYKDESYYLLKDQFENEINDSIKKLENSNDENKLSKIDTLKFYLKRIESDLSNETLNNTNSVKIDSAAIKSLKSFFTENKDKYSSISTTWIKPKNMPEYRNRNGIYCYFAKYDDDKVGNFRFVFQYYSDNWLFIEDIVFLVDGKIYKYNPGRMEKDNDTSIWEWFDNSVTESDEYLIKAIANAKSVELKLNGKKYYDEKKLTSKQIEGIKNTYNYYLAMGGHF